MISWLDLKNLDFKKVAIVSMVLLLLSLLGVWGSREMSHKSQITSFQESAKAVEQKILSLTHEKTEIEAKLKKTATIKTKKVPIILDNGVIAYVEESVSETIEEAITTTRNEYETRLDNARLEILKLHSRLDQKIENVSRAAPLFSILANYEPMAATPEAVSLGLGVNVGAFTLGALQTLEMKLNPRIHAALRF